MSGFAAEAAVHNAAAERPKSPMKRHSLPAAADPIVAVSAWPLARLLSPEAVGRSAEWPLSRF